jgi:uncharacterized membrane protein YfcA
VLPEFSSFQLAILGALVFFAGVVDSLAGGGGLITVPAYMAVGLPPHLVLGTNKLGSSIGTVVSAVRFHARLKFSLWSFAPVVAVSLIGAALGAKLALLLDPSFIRYLLVVALPLVAWSVWSKHAFGSEDRSREYPFWRTLAVTLPVGAYDGFFGPGTGTFFALGFTRFCGYDLLGSTGRAKILNLASNVAALATFLAGGAVHVKLGLAMGALSVGGHWVGSHLGLKKGAEAIRPMILVVCGALFAKLVWDLSR